MQRQRVDDRDETVRSGEAVVDHQTKEEPENSVPNGVVDLCVGGRGKSCAAAEGERALCV